MCGAICGCLTFHFCSLVFYLGGSHILNRVSNPRPPDNHSPDYLTQILTEMWDYRLLLYLFTPLLRGPYFSLDISRATKSL